MLDESESTDFLDAQRMLAEEIDRQQREIASLRREIAAVTGTLSYRLMARLWPLRRRLIPPQSEREKMLHRLLQYVADAHPVRRDGRAYVQSHDSAIASVTAQLRAEPDIVTSAPPRVTVLNSDPALDDALRAWSLRQTWPAVEVSPWRGRVHESESWGRYVCVGSADLITRPATWLEISVLVLEREKCAFVVNLCGRSIWHALQLRRGRLPGSPEQPLLRTVVRRECITAELGLRVREYVRDCERAAPHESIVVGRVIHWTSGATDQFRELPFRTSIADDVSAGAPRLDDSAQTAARQSASQESPIDSLIITADEPQPAEVHAAPAVHRLFAVPATPDSRPTVLVFQPFLAVGGAERVTLDVMHALADRIRFVVVATDAHEAHLGTTVERFRALTPHVYTAHDFLPGSERRNFIEYLIMRYHPRTFYIANGSAWLLDELAAVRKAHPELRIVNQVYDHRIGWIERYDAELISAIDVHIGANTHIAAAYERRGVPPTAILRIPHGIDLDEYDPSGYDAAAVRRLRGEFGLPDDSKIITFIGRMHPQKRPVDFIEMARQSQQQSQWSFFMVGDGPWAEVVDEQIRRLRLRNIVRRSFHEPSRDVYAASDLIVLASQYEGMPLVVLEAQAMGKPVVATDVGNVREILTSTQGGRVIAKIGHPELLRHAVGECLRIRIDLERTRAMLGDRFGMSVVAGQYERAFIGDAQAGDA